MTREEKCIAVHDKIKSRIEVDRAGFISFMYKIYKSNLEEYTKREPLTLEKWQEGAWNRVDNKEVDNELNSFLEDYGTEVHK